MIDAIISFSLRQRVFVLLAAAGLMAAGLWSAARLPIDAVPDITNIQVQINTEIKGLAPEEIEKLVTYPLEMEMFGAGSKPAGYVHPKAIEVMREIGIDISGHRSKHLEEFLGQSKIETVITVCGNADQACPIFQAK